MVSWQVREVKGDKCEREGWVSKARRMEGCVGALQSGTPLAQRRSCCGSWSRLDD